MACTKHGVSEYYAYADLWHPWNRSFDCGLRQVREHLEFTFARKEKPSPYPLVAELSFAAEAASNHGISHRHTSPDGPCEIRVVNHQLPFRSEPYTLSYFTDNQQTSTDQQQKSLQAPIRHQHDTTTGVHAHYGKAFLHAYHLWQAWTKGNLP